MSPDDGKADLVLDAVKLVRTQLEIRDRRRADEPEEKVRAAATALAALRRAWWSRVQQADRQTGGHPLAQLAQRVGLEPEEVDLLIVALVAQLEPDLRDAIARPGRGAVTVDALVELHGHDARTRFEARRRLTPIAPLARHGLLALHPPDPGTGDLEVRPTEALVTFVLGRPLEAGPLGFYGRLSAPACTWAHVVVPEDAARRVRELAAGAPAMRKSLDEWGLGRIAPRARGVAVLVVGPAGTGKATLAHALAHGLGRPILTLHTPRLASAGPRLRVVLAELLGVAATSGALALIEDAELLADAPGAGAHALLEALDHHLGPDGIVVVTCNDPARVPPALTRRVHLRVDFTVPDAAARAAIWRVHLPAEVPLAPDVDVAALAADHPLVGARIRDAVAHALAMMAARGEPQLSAALLGEAAAAQRTVAPVTPGGRPPA